LEEQGSVGPRFRGDRQDLIPVENASRLGSASSFNIYCTGVLWTWRIDYEMGQARRDLMPKKSVKIGPPPPPPPPPPVIQEDSFDLSKKAGQLQKSFRRSRGLSSNWRIWDWLITLLGKPSIGFDEYSCLVSVTRANT